MRSSKVVGRRIQNHRMNLGLSPEQFGWTIGVSGMTVRRIESGANMQTRTAFLIAQSVGCPVTELLSPGPGSAPSRVRVAA